MMSERRVPLDSVISREVALQGWTLARTQDVDHGGLYDVRSAAINIWSHPWNRKADLAASELLGTVYVSWHDPNKQHVRVWLLEVEKAGAQAELERHLAVLFGIGVVRQ